MDMPGWMKSVERRLTEQDRRIRSKTGGTGTTAWASITGKPSTFKPDVADVDLTNKFGTYLVAPEPTSVHATDTANLQATIDAAEASGQGVFLRPGKYTASGLVVHHSNLHITSGAGATQPDALNRGAVIQRGAASPNEPIITWKGTSASHLWNLHIENVKFKGNDYSAPLLDIGGATSLRLTNCFFHGVTGEWLKLTEVWDSRIIDCNFEWGGSADGTVPGIHLRSSADGFTDNTNNLYLFGCRFESFKSSAIATSGTNNNNIVITACKFETGTQSTPTPYLDFKSGTANVVFNGVLLHASGTGTLEALVKLTGVNSATGTLIMQRTASGTVAITNYLKVATSKNIYLNLHLLSFSSPAPAGGSVVSWDGAGDCAFEVFAEGVLSSTIKSVSTVTGQRHSSPTFLLRPGGDSEATYRLMRADSSDTWDLGRIAPNGSGTYFRLMHNAVEIFQITDDNVFSFKRGFRGVRTGASHAGGALAAFDATTGNSFAVHLNGNVTSSALSNGQVGQVVIISFSQDGVAGRTVVWPTNCRFAGNTPPGFGGANTRTSVTFEWTGAVWSELSRAVAVPTS